MNRNAEGLSLQTIVIAALVLIVLVILTIIFAGKMGEFRTGTRSCAGSCVSRAVDCDLESSNPIYLNGCDDGSGSSQDRDFCCVPIKK